MVAHRMSERLRHLQRQQTLLREHLAWIEAEIAHESPAITPAAHAALTAPAALPPAADAANPNETVAPLTPVTSAVASTPAALADADSLLERYAATERQNPTDIRRGCFIVFFAALFLVAAGVAAVWFIFYR